VPLHDRWRHGLRFESADKAFSLSVGGRLQFDGVQYLTSRAVRGAVPGVTPLEDGVSFRRARLDMSGTIYKHVDFFAQVDFVNGFVAVPGANPRLTDAAYPTDLWVTFRELPVIGNLRVGNQKPLYSFEHLTSSRFLNFLERSPGFDAFAEGFNNGFQPGVAAFDTYADKHGTWGVGVFKTTRNPFGWNVGRGEVEVNGRVTYLPVYEDGGRRLLHVGVGGADRGLDDGQARFRARLDARNSPSGFASLLADTGLFNGSHQQLLVPELVAVAGPLSLQSELYASWVEGTANGTAFVWSAYAELHWFLTGEHREYNRDTAVFGRVVPKSPLDWSRAGFTGTGAWQLALRYGYLDLDTAGVAGGRSHTVTAGANWFLNPNMKVQFNYFVSARSGFGPPADNLIHGFATRLAIDF
jgi:phosphate-selective porin OprO and OprP